MRGFNEEDELEYLLVRERSSEHARSRRANTDCAVSEAVPRWRPMRHVIHVGTMLPT